MINIPPIKSTTNIKQEAIPDITKVWKVGQILNARSETSAKALDNVVLRIGEQRLQAQTPVDLKTGESLKLLVKELGDPPLLSIQAKVKTTDKAAAEQLKQFIKQPLDLKNTLALLNKLQTQTALPDNLRSSLQSLLRQLPDLALATQTPALKSLIQNNAIFFEPLLNNKPSGLLKNNLKQQLLGLHKQILENTPQAAQISSNPKELIQQLFSQFQQGTINSTQLINRFINALSGDQFNKALTALNQPDKNILSGNINQLVKQLTQLLQTKSNTKILVDYLKQQLQTMNNVQDLKISLENLINKITTQQLLPLSRDIDNPLLLLFSLILKDQKELHLIDFKIEQQSSAKRKEHKDWLVNIKFDFPESGVIQAKVHLFDNQVSTFFQAEKATTIDFIQKNMPQLKNALQQAGFQIMQLYAEQKSIRVQPELPEGIHILDENI